MSENKTSNIDPNSFSTQTTNIAANIAAPSIDEFFRGKLKVYQPNDGAHKAGLDALLIGASVPQNASGALLDMGAGTGVAGFGAASRAPSLKSVVLAEINPASCELLERSLAETVEAKIASICSVFEGDIRALEAYESFDYVICNPPFNDDRYRVSPNSNRALAHQVSEDMSLEDWVVLARKFLKPKGQFSLILRPENLAQILSELSIGFGNIKLLPVHPKEDLPAKRLLITAIKGRKTPLQILPPLVLHQADGSPSDDAQSIFDGGGLPS